jgi:hypothetical protein
MGGICSHCHLFNDSIHYTADYGEICSDCSLEITRPYIAETQNEDGTYTVELDSDLVEKLEKLIHDDRKRREEIENDPSPIWHNGIEYANMSECREKCQQF